MPLKIKLESDTGENDGRTNDFNILGRGAHDDSVVVHIKDIDTGVVTRMVLPTDQSGNFSYLPTGLDDGKFMVRVRDLSNDERDHVRVKLDTDADTKRDVSLKFGDPVTDKHEVAFSIKGLDSDAKVKVTFTDAAGDTVTRTVNDSGDFTVNLTSLDDGPITTTLEVIDTSTNTTTVTGDDTVICFFAGTRIATPSGTAAVEALAAGDLVVTTDGETRPVLWVGRQTVSTRFGDAARVLPIRIAAGALGAALPLRDLLVSPDHALLIDGVLVQAAALVNGTTIRRDAAVPTVFTYYHVELAEHALILAEGVPAETFIDNAGRLAFDNWHEHAAMHPTGATLQELPLPRAKSHRQVPAAARARIAERAAVLAGGLAAAA